MLKKSLSFMVLGGLIAGSSFAIQPFQFLQKNQNKAQSVAKNTPKMQAPMQQYTDFSGEWTGSCSGQDFQEDINFTIKNDAFSITFDGQTFAIGGNLSTESYANPWATSFGHMSFYWNEDKSTLMGDSVNVFKFHNDNNGSMNEYPVSSSIESLTLSIKDDKLVAEGRGKSFTGLNQEGEMASICTFTKVEH